MHKLVLEALVRFFFLVRFEEVHQRDACLSKEAFKLLMDRIENLGTDTASKLKPSEEFRTYFDKYNAFKSEALNDIHGKTAQFWTRYVTIIETILILIRDTKENYLDLHIAALYALCPMFFSYDHCNYARYVPCYLVTLTNLRMQRATAKEWFQCFPVICSTVQKLGRYHN